MKWASNVVLPAGGGSSVGAGGLEPPYPHAAHGAPQSTPLPQFSAIDEEEEEKEEETPQKKKILKKKEEEKKRRGR